MFTKLKKILTLSGSSAIMILFVISLILFTLLITELVQSKIILAIFAIAMALLGVMSNGFKK